MLKNCEAHFTTYRLLRKYFHYRPVIVVPITVREHLKKIKYLQVQNHIMQQFNEHAPVCSGKIWLNSKRLQNNMTTTLTE